MPQSIVLYATRGGGPAITGALVSAMKAEFRRNGGRMLSEGKVRWLRRVIRRGNKCRISSPA